MGGLMEALGEMTAAEDWFRRAMKSNAADTIAVTRLARVLRYQVADEHVGLIERRIADPSLTETDRIPLLFAAANVFDKRRRTAMPPGSCNAPTPRSWPETGCGRECILPVTMSDWSVT